MEKLLQDGIDSKLFSERVKEARAGLSQEQFGKKCNLSAQAISKYEQGGKDDGGFRMPTFGNAASIAKAAGVSLDWLAGRVGDDRKMLHADDADKLRLETYGDLYRVFEHIIDSVFPGAAISIEEYVDTRYEMGVSGYPEEYEVKKERICLRIPDKKLVTFQKGLMRFEEAGKESAEFSDVADYAITQLKAQMNSAPLPEYKKPSRSSLADITPEDIPF